MATAVIDKAADASKQLVFFAGKAVWTHGSPA